MFGRIQSVFLLAAAIFASLMFFFPVANISVPNGGEFQFFTSKVMQGDDMITWNYASLILNVAIAVLAFVTIFVKVRKTKSMRPTLLLQMRFCVITVFLQIGMIAMILFQVLSLAKEMNATWSIAYAFIFPSVAVLFTILAIRGLIKDISTLKSYDRIR